MMIGRLPIRIALWPLVALVALCLLEGFAIVSLNEGRFVFTLDDPYIHLRLAENIAQGHYGINQSEPSAPSSSILWPFLLSPVAFRPYGEYLPLALNFVVSAGAVIALSAIIQRVGVSHCRGVFLIVVLILGTNLVPLIFSGMEHSLQVFLALAVVLGLILETENNRFPRWFWPTMVLLPLVRYEGLIITGATLGYLLLRRRFLSASLSLLVIACLLGGFSWYLSSLGLEWLPNSVIIKSRTLTSGDHLFSQVTIQLWANLLSRQGCILAGATLLFFPVIWNPQRTAPERCLAAWILLVISGHLLHAPMFGQSLFLHFHRYDAYAFAVVIATFLYLHRSTMRRLIDAPPFFQFGVYAFGGLLLVSQPYLRDLLLTPTAANNIYQQHDQMRRFAQQHYQHPIAVNDLGLVSYHNPNYVLDFLGLGSQEAFHQRVANTSNDWMTDLAHKHRVHAAIIYDSWFPNIPDHWIRVAQLHLGNVAVSAGDATASFYALDKEGLHEMKPALSAFQRELPPGVRLEWDAGLTTTREKANGSTTS